MNREQLFRLLLAPRSVFLVRCVIGLVFIYAGVIKIAEPLAFAAMLRGYDILPFRLLNLAAIIVPGIEVLLGVALMLPVWRKGSAMLATALFLVFFVAVASSVLRGIDIDCGCFSTKVGSNPVTWLTLARDFLFLLSGVYLTAAEYLRMRAR